MITSSRARHGSFTIRGFVLGLLLATSAGPLLAQAPDSALVAPPDTLTPEVETFFVRRDAYVAAGFALTTVALFPLDRVLAREAQDSSFQAIRFARNAARTLSAGGSAWGWMVAAGAVYGVGQIGGKPTLARTGLHTAEAILVGDAITRIVKGVAGRARPLVDIDAPEAFRFGRGFGDHDYQSFPSGHTAGSFAAASALTSEVSHHWPEATWYVGPALYTTAGLVGLSRMYNNRHWASDVVLGAAIGTFSGLKVVRQNHMHPNNRLDRWLVSASALPDGRGGAVLVVRRTF